MKIAAMICRYLLGLVFTVFGLNGFFHFLPMPPMPGLAGQFMGAVFGSHFWVLIFAVQALGGLMLLANRYVPLALVALAAVIVNIINFHINMEPAGLPLAIVVGILWTVVAVWNKRHLAGIFVQRTE